MHVFLSMYLHDLKYKECLVLLGEHLSVCVSVRGSGAAG